MDYEKLIRDSMAASKLRTAEDVARMTERLNALLGQVSRSMEHWGGLKTGTGYMMTANLRGIQEEISAAIRAAGAVMNDDLAPAWAKFWNLGSDQVIGFGQTTKTLFAHLEVSSRHLSLWDDSPPALIKGVTDEILSKVGRTLRMSALAGEDQAQAFGKIKKLLVGSPERWNQRRFGGFGYQVERVYVTETQRLFGLGQYDAAEAWETQLDVELIKIWRHQRGFNAMARDHHVAMDGQKRKRTEKFSNGLLFPNHPEGSAAETINCHCFLLMVPPETADEITK